MRNLHDNAQQRTDQSRKIPANLVRPEPEITGDYVSARVLTMSILADMRLQTTDRLAPRVAEALRLAAAAQFPGVVQVLRPGSPAECQATLPAVVLQWDCRVQSPVTVIHLIVSG